MLKKIFYVCVLKYILIHKTTLESKHGQHTKSNPLNLPSKIFMIPKNAKHFKSFSDRLTNSTKSWEKIVPTTDKYFMPQHVSVEKKNKKRMHRNENFFLTQNSDIRSVLKSIYIEIKFLAAHDSRWLSENFIHWWHSSFTFGIWLYRLLISHQLPV